jgi:hypothetical protein
MPCKLGFIESNEQLPADGGLQTKRNLHYGGDVVIEVAVVSALSRSNSY